MIWDDVRKAYPSSWLLVEAVKAHTANSQRILEDLSVIKTLPDSVNGWRAYNEMHKAFPQRELYIFHTDREQLNIEEIRWLGIRAA